MILYFILDSPKVSAHRHIVNTIRGSDAHLHCAYNTSSMESVTWRKTNETIDFNNSNKYSILNESKNSANPQSKSTLVIKAVQSSDLGEYECEVKNLIGKGHSKVQLVVQPEPARIIKVDLNEDTATLQWQIHSFQPLIEVWLNYKKAGVSSFIYIFKLYILYIYYIHLLQNNSWLKDQPIHSDKNKEHSGIWR